MALSDIVGKYLEHSYRSDALEAQESAQKFQESFALLELEGRKESEQKKIDAAQTELVLKHQLDSLDRIHERIATTEESFKEYNKLNSEDMTGAFPALLDEYKTVDGNERLDLQNIKKNITALRGFNRQQTQALTELKGQEGEYNQIRGMFAGSNKILQPHEYYANPDDDIQQMQEYLLSPEEEGGLGWTTTAGADRAYEEVNPVQREQWVVANTDRYKKPLAAGAEGSYLSLRSIFTAAEEDGEFVEDSEDLADRLGNFTPEQVTALRQMFGQQVDYDDFVTNLYAMPADMGGEALRAALQANPNTTHVWHNLIRDVTAIEALDNEMEGIVIPEGESIVNTFIDSIVGITDKGVLFRLFDEYSGQIAATDEDAHAQLFSAIEGQVGEEDLWDEYISGEWKDGKKKKIEEITTLDEYIELIKTEDEERKLARKDYRAKSNAYSGAMNRMRSGAGTSVLERAIPKMREQGMLKRLKTGDYIPVGFLFNATEMDFIRQEVYNTAARWKGRTGGFFQRGAKDARNLLLKYQDFEDAWTDWKPLQDEMDVADEKILQSLDFLDDLTKY